MKRMFLCAMNSGIVTIYGNLEKKFILKNIGLKDSDFIKGFSNGEVNKYLFYAEPIITV